MLFGLKKFSTRNFDWVLMMAVGLLMILGLEAIYSVDLSRGNEVVFFKRQLMFVGIGGVLLFGVSMVQYTFFRTSAKLWYIAAIILLISVLILGESIRGTRGWFRVAGFSFQPVEFAKLGLILMLAYIVAHFGRRFEQPLFFIGTACVAGLPIVLIMLQPDLGSAIILGLIWLSLMLLVKVKRLHMALLVVAVVLASTLAWFFFLKDYQKDRLRNFINPERDRGGSGYNVTQSRIAVGSGKLLGRGLGFGSQSQLRFLPEAQTDFVFSVIAEELGFAGVAVLLVLFGIIFWRLSLIMQKAEDDFIVITVAGITIVLFSQFFMNIGAEIGLLPLTGITVPFVSYGGSSLIIDMLMIGIAQSMIVRKY